VFGHFSVTKIFPSDSKHTVVAIRSLYTFVAHLSETFVINAVAMSLNPPGTNPFAHRPGCPLCGVVATPFHRSDLGGSIGGPYGLVGTSYTPYGRDVDDGAVQSGSATLPTTPSTSSFSSSTNTIVYKDGNITAYVEKMFPVSSKGHIIIVLKLVEFILGVSLPSEGEGELICLALYESWMSS
jgi:hypothetical protein